MMALFKKFFKRIYTDLKYIVYLNYLKVGI